MKKIVALILVCLMVLSGAAVAETLKMATNAAFPPYAATMHPAPKARNNNT